MLLQRVKGEACQPPFSCRLSFTCARAATANVGIVKRPGLVSWAERGILQLADCWPTPLCPRLPYVSARSRRSPAGGLGAQGFATIPSAGKETPPPTRANTLETTCLSHHRPN